MKKIQGIIPPMVTPLLDNGTLDLEGAKRIADNMIDAGVAAIFLLGTTGEAQSIAMHLRYEFVEFMCAHIAGRVPVLVAVTETSMEDSLALAAHAKKCGAVAVVSAPPYYFPANQKELICWYTALADACPLPVFLYNMPSKVKVFFDVPTVVELSKHPNIIGLKDSSGKTEYLKELIGIFRGTDFALYMGPEEMTAEVVMAGADGGVNGGANLFPRLFVEMYAAAAALRDQRPEAPLGGHYPFFKLPEGSLRALEEIQARIMYLSDSLYHMDPSSDASFLRGVKCAMGLKGLCSGYLAYPYRAYEGETKEKVRSVLEDLESRGYR